MKLPPLNALRSFEVAARTGNFTAAGKELGVTSAAISQQVRKLEDSLGRNLFFRNNNNLKLTDAGRDLYQNTAAALSEISDFTTGLLQPSGPRPLVISALPSLADRWLPGVLTRMEDMPVTLRIEEDPVDMESNHIGLRLCYGGDDYAGYWVRTLFYDSVVPMGSPDLASDWDVDPEAAADARLIHMDWGASFTRTPKWKDWIAAYGDIGLDQRGITVPGCSAALALAEAGAGIALGQLKLAKIALNEGRLVKLSRKTLALPQPYVVVVANARLASRRIQRFLALLSKGN